jgi:hypothetical protein
MTLGGPDRVLAELVGLIERYGWAVRHVGAGAEPGEAAFSYTVGLTGLGHPEVVITGMPFDSSQAFLNLIGDEVRQGRRFAAGLVTEELTRPGAAVVFIPVHDVSGLAAVRQVFGQIEAVQMVWSDSAGRLPWHSGYANRADAQPLLGPFSPSP